MSLMRNPVQTFIRNMAAPDRLRALLALVGAAQTAVE